MRYFSILLSLIFASLFGSAALAQDTYATANGETVTDLEVFQDCELCPEMIVLPKGTFRMGSTFAEIHAERLRHYKEKNIDTSGYEEKLRQSFLRLNIDPDDPEEGLLRYYASPDYKREDDPQYNANGMLHEIPAHNVTIDLPIAMGRNEVTREEWDACVRDGGCEQGQSEVSVFGYTTCEETTGCVPNPDSRIAFRLQLNPPDRLPLDPRQPRVGVTYFDIQDYVSWLNSKIGQDLYRIPTEAEWEYAAKAGTTTRFAQGDTLSLDQANFRIATVENVEGKWVITEDPRNAGRLLPVDHLDAANAWGLRHMSGNAIEFTSTCGAGPHRGFSRSSSYLEADKDRTDCKRSIKGGFYQGHASLGRPARRTAVRSAHWSTWLGFRVVRDLQPVTNASE